MAISCPRSVGKVFPTCVGMNRCIAFVLNSTHSDPHVRGDEPDLPYDVAGAFECASALAALQIGEWLRAN